MWSLPAGVSSAVLAEADRRDATPSQVVADLFLERFPEFVADSIRRSIASGALPVIEADQPEPAPTGALDGGGSAPAVGRLEV
jgi:hypothetical protein